MLGYLFRGSSSPVNVSADAASSSPHAPEGREAPPSAESLRPLAAPLRKALELDPQSWKTLVELGNLYYDHQRYSEAAPYYERALALRPDDVNVRTDLGTAFWYAGFPEKAVREFEKALAVEDHYPQTLFNLGIVRLEGLKDPAGAIAAWEKLLEKNPQYAEKQRVLGLIAQARSRQESPR